MVSWKPVLIVALCAGRSCWSIDAISWADICGLHSLRFLGAIAALALRWAEVRGDPDGVGEVDRTGAQSENEDVEENDLLRQVRKIEGLLVKKMNLKSFQHFENKEYDDSVKVKKSLEKLHQSIKDITFVQDKLKFLIRYKQDKGF